MQLLFHNSILITACPACFFNFALIPQEKKRINDCKRIRNIKLELKSAFFLAQLV